jgi:hypothetical protein
LIGLIAIGLLSQSFDAANWFLNFLGWTNLVKFVNVVVGFSI